MRISFDDISCVLAHWAGPGPIGDANSDSLVDFQDISEVLANWGADCAMPFVEGSYAVARRILGYTTTPARLYLVGDSLCSDSYSPVDTTNTSLQYGIVRTWRPPNWSGIYITANGAGGDRYSFSTLTPGPRIQPGEDLPGLGRNPSPVGVSDCNFESDQSPFGPFAQFYTQQVGTRYGVGAWPAGRALTARLIYLANPEGAAYRARSWRPFPNIVGERQPFHGPASELEILYEDVSIPASPEENIGVGVYGAFPNTDETGSRFISLGARIFDPANQGFELVIAGIGGSTPRDHTSEGGPIFGYTDAALEQFLAAVESNTFWILLGQNQADGTAMASQLNDGDPTLFRQFLTDVISRYHSAAIAAGIPEPQFLLVNTYKTGYSDVNAQTRFLAMRQIASSRSDSLAIDLFTLGGPDTEPWLVDGVHCTRAGADHFARLIWQTLEALAHRTEKRP